MAIITTNNQNYIDIADAIRAKGVSGTFKPSEMASAIVSIPAGGASRGSVRFIDYNGEMVEEWSADSVDSKTALPDNPTHEGLVGQGWNWSLENIKSYISKYPESTVNVGQMYKTASGLSEFDITLTKVTGLTVEFSADGNKNWGDGTITTDDTHTYADYGDYTITWDMQSLSSKPSTGVSRVRVGEYVTSIDEGVFADCDSLSSITIPDSVTSIGEGAFASCYSLSSITIPDKVISIGAGAFAGCYSISSIAFFDSVTSISEGAFESCYSLTSITIPDRVTSIEGGAFVSCYSLTSITIPDSVTSIGEGAFATCQSLTSITIPDGVTSIGDSAFADCLSLTSITIPDGITSIGKSAFANCYSLSSITIPDGVTSIGGGAFVSCYSLTSITIPGSVTSIDFFTFQDCYSLTSITIPEGVISIGYGAFFGCSKIIKYNFSQAASVPTLASAAFNSINSIAKIVVPDALYDEWIAATNWSTYADYIYKVSEITEDPIETEPDEEEPELVE